MLAAAGRTSSQLLWMFLQGPAIHSAIPCVSSPFHPAQNQRRGPHSLRVTQSGPTYLLSQAIWVTAQPMDWLIRRPRLISWAGRWRWVRPRGSNTAVWGPVSRWLPPRPEWCPALFALLLIFHSQLWVMTQQGLSWGLLS